MIEIRIERTKVNIDHSHLRFLQDVNDEVAVSEYVVSNHDNFAYSGLLYVGSHKQPLNFILDSGSSVMWVQSEDCPRPS